MDELIAKQNHGLQNSYNSHSENKTDPLKEFSPDSVSLNAEAIEESIISQSLEFKDWLPHIQPTTSVNQAKARKQAGRLHSHLGRSFSPGRILRKLIRTMTGREYFKVLKVEQACYLYSELLWGGYIDFPKEKDQFHGSIISSSGWVLGKAASAIAVQAKIDDTVIAEIPVQISRPDVIRVFVSVPNMASGNTCCGFNGKLSIKKLPDAGFLKFQAVLADGNTAPLGFIQFRK